MRSKSTYYVIETIERLFVYLRFDTHFEWPHLAIVERTDFNNI